MKDEMDPRHETEEKGRANEEGIVDSEDDELLDDEDDADDTEDEDEDLEV